MDVFTMAFMQRAVIAALLAGVMAPAIGTYIVQRRLSLLGDGLGHVAIAGVGLAMMTGTAPLPVAVIVCMLGAVGVELLRQQGRATGDIGLAVLFYGGLAAGVMMAGVAGQGAGTLSQFLFGSLTSVTASDIWVIAVLGAVVLVPTISLASRLFAVCADEDFAQVLGLRVRWLNLLIVALAALTVVTAMRTVGLLLVSAMMVIPVATAQNLVSGFHRGLFLAMGLGAVTALGGVGGSYALDTAPGATIVVLSIVVFLATWPISVALSRRSASLPATEEDAGDHVIAHEESHDPADHLAIQHGDHVDYLHDGHRHAPHGDHYDEH